MNCCEPVRGKTPRTRDADEIRILAMVLHPGGDLDLVGHADGARIDLLRAPAMDEAAAGEAFAEAAGGARRVAEHRPDQLGVGIGQRALDGVPYRIGDGRRLVQKGEGAAALVVQAGDGLGVLLRPGDGIDPPGLVRGRVRPNGAPSRCR